ncbi:hypothetical protein HYU15_04230 [Candidatus Woesearchaeota archaeon]|nr:hypothetical protein [Candidatus Woesearchaeota archaeon]
MHSDCELFPNGVIHVKRGLKKWRVLFSAAVIALLLMPFSYAGHSKDIKIERINVIDEDRAVSVRIKNNDASMRVKISAVIPELGVIATRGPFLVGAGERTSRVVVLEDVPSYASGEYMLRIVAKDKTKSLYISPI